MKKNIKIEKISSCILAGIILFTGINSTRAVSFAQNNNFKQKEEVVYVKTDEKGIPQKIDVVNIFPGGKITDYGNYTKVSMMTTRDKLTKKGDKITFSSKAKRVFYQGKMTDAEIPWNINISYYLNEKEIDPKSLAGKKGDLKINISVKKNLKSDNIFYEKYPLQINILLDMEKCSNIKASEATITNMGKNKQITYTMLPGKTLDVHITSKIRNFEMEGISINGVRLNMNMDLDKSSIDHKVKNLTMGTDKIKGASERVAKGTTTLAEAMNKLLIAFNKIEFFTKYSTYKSTFKSKGLNTDRLQKANKSTADKFRKEIASLKKMIISLEAVPGKEKDITKLKSQIRMMENTALLLDANSKAIDGTESYFNFLNSKTNDCVKGLRTVDKSTLTLEKGASKLNTGSIVLANKTKGITGKVDGEMYKILNTVKGSNKPVKSFASPKNKTIRSLQFVIKTQEIEKPEKKSKEKHENIHKSFWQKLLDLFIS